MNIYFCIGGLVGGQMGALSIIVTPASGVGTTAVVLATARYYHSVLPP